MHSCTNDSGGWMRACERVRKWVRDCVCVFVLLLRGREERHQLRIYLVIRIFVVFGYSDAVILNLLSVISLFYPLFVECNWKYVYTVFIFTHLSSPLQQHKTTLGEAEIQSAVEAAAVIFKKVVLQRRAAKKANEEGKLIFYPSYFILYFTFIERKISTLNRIK